MSPEREVEKCLASNGQNKAISEKEGSERVFISYLDETNKVINGYCDLIKISDSVIKIATDKNLITIPLVRVLKIKQEKGGQNGKA